MDSTPRKMALIATKGTLDMAYPPFILASTAAALGYQVQIFFSFYGLQLLSKNLDHIRISPLANPAMPSPMPLPTLMKALPGMEAMATGMMKAKMQKKGIASLEELRTLCLDSGVEFIACEMTLSLFELDRSDLIDGIDFGGAATFVDFAGDAEISLFV
jgi:peroxiredoxin family protein